MNILFLGDIVGKPGLRAVAVELTCLREQYDVDLCIGNAENAAGGFGLTPEVADGLFSLGIDVLTSGNHIFDKRDILAYLVHETRVLRPANYPLEAPGVGSFLVKTDKGNMVGVLNLMGRVFIDSIDCPFKKADEEIKKLKKKTNVIFVDFHAEATSEKNAIGWYLDGKVSAVVGSHTHVQTADEKILPKGTAYLTDAGMTGPVNSVIGIKTETAINRFITHMPKRFETASGEAQLNGTLIKIDQLSGKAKSIQRIQVKPIP